MYPLTLASVLALAIIIERFISLRKRKIIIPEIISVVEQFSSFKDMELAKNICTKYRGPLSNLIQIGLENTDLERAEIKELIEDQGRQEVRHLEKGMTILETIAVISPLMGLLGTVLGMIKVFGVIKEQGIGQAAALSGGISEALITTV
jgi:biopolymer transport protein ExbB